MAKNRTEKSKYHSRYSQGFVAAAQYVTELICERKAAQDKKELPIKFWKFPEWAAYFRNQIATAHKLLKKYREAAIIKALIDPKNGKTYSLRSPILEKYIIEEHNSILLHEKQAEINRKEREGRDVAIQVGTNERPTFKAKNRMNALDEIDNN